MIEWFTNLPEWLKWSCVLPLIILATEYVIMPFRVNILFSRAKKILKNMKKTDEKFDIIEKQIQKDEKVLALMLMQGSSKSEEVKEVEHKDA